MPIFGLIGGGGMLASQSAVVTNGGSVNPVPFVRKKLYLEGSGGPVTMSSTPFGTSSLIKDGSELYVIGNHADRTVTIQYADVPFGCIGNFSEITLSLNQVAKFVFSESKQRFVFTGGLNG